MPKIKILILDYLKNNKNALASIIYLLNFNKGFKKRKNSIKVIKV